MFVPLLTRTTALAVLATAGSVTRATVPVKGPKVVGNVDPPSVDRSTDTEATAALFVHATMISVLELKTSSRPGASKVSADEVTLNEGLAPEPRAVPEESLQVTPMV